MATAKKTKVGPVKIGLIVILALVLLVVLVVEFALPAMSQASIPTSKSNKSAQPDSKSDAEFAENGQHTTVSETWPVMTIDEIVSHDPFKLPSQLEKKEQSLSPSHTELPEERNNRARTIESQQAFRDSLTGLVVDQIVIGVNGRVAMIGSRRLRIGDVYNGLRIIDIHRDGIVVVPVDED